MRAFYLPNIAPSTDAERILPISAAVFVCNAIELFTDTEMRSRTIQNNIPTDIALNSIFLSLTREVPNAPKKQPMTPDAKTIMLAVLSPSRLKYTSAAIHKMQIVEKNKASKVPLIIARTFIKSPFLHIFAFSI